MIRPVSFVCIDRSQISCYCFPFPESVVGRIISRSGEFMSFVESFFQLVADHRTLAFFLLFLLSVINLRIKGRRIILEAKAKQAAIKGDPRRLPLLLLINATDTFNVNARTLMSLAMSDKVFPEKSLRIPMIRTELSDWLERMNQSLANAPLGVEFPGHEAITESEFNGVYPMIKELDELVAEAIFPSVSRSIQQKIDDAAAQNAPSPSARKFWESFARFVGADDK